MAELIVFGLFLGALWGAIKFAAKLGFWLAAFFVVVTAIGGLL